MAHHLVDAGVVGHHKAPEAPLVAENFLHEVLVGGGGYAVQLVERCHDAESSGIDGGLIRREIELPQPPFRHIYGIVVPSGLGSAVSGVVLDAGEQGALVFKVFSLIAAGEGRRYGAAQVRVFARAFRNPSPAGLDAYIAHGRVGPVQAGRSCFVGGHLGGTLYGFGVPGAGHSQVDGENGAEAVYDIIAEEQRNTEAGFVNRDFLELAGVIGRVGVEDVAAASLAYVVDIAFAHAGAGYRPVAGEQDGLPDFLLESHFTQQFFYAGIRPFGAAGAGAQGYGAGKQEV